MRAIEAYITRLRYHARGPANLVIAYCLFGIACLVVGAASNNIGLIVVALIVQFTGWPLFIAAVIYADYKVGREYEMSREHEQYSND